MAGCQVQYGVLLSLAVATKGFHWGLWQYEEIIPLALVYADGPR